MDGWLVVLKLIKSLYGAGTLNSYPVYCVQHWTPALTEKREGNINSLCVVLLLCDLTFENFVQTKLVSSSIKSTVKCDLNNFATLKSEAFKSSVLQHHTQQLSM